jgi:hypothetical protein
MTWCCIQFVSTIDLHQLGPEDWEIIHETEDEDRCAPFQSDLLFHNLDIQRAGAI